MKLAPLLGLGFLASVNGQSCSTLGYTECHADSNCMMDRFGVNCLDLDCDSDIASIYTDNFFPSCADKCPLECCGDLDETDCGSYDTYCEWRVDQWGFGDCLGGDSGYGPGPGGDEQGPACNPNDYDFDYPPDVQAYATCIANQDSNSDNNNGGYGPGPGGGGCSDHPDMATCLGDEACMPEPDPNDPLAAPSCVTLDCGLLDEGFCGNYPLCAGSAPQCVDVCGEFASTTPDVSLTTYTEVQDITQQTCGAGASFQIANYEPTSSYFFYPTGPQINPSGFVTSLAPGTTYTVQATMSDGCKEQMSDDIIIDAAPDCTCGANEKVVGNVCVACLAGKTNGADDDASGDDTECDATLCGADEKVVSNACVACLAGKTNGADDDASGDDTSCDATLCVANEKVVSNVCTPCTGDETNDAGDDASGGDTSCDAPVAPPVVEDTADDIASPACSTDMEATAYQAAGCCDC